MIERNKKEVDINQNFRVGKYLPIITRCIFSLEAFVYIG